MLGELRLWVEVLSQAVCDVVEPIAWSREKEKNLRNESLAWLEDDSEMPGSAQWICNNIGLDLMLVRKKTREKLENGKLRKNSSGNDKEINRTDERVNCS
jgi:hypothetical protein